MTMDRSMASLTRRGFLGTLGVGAGFLSCGVSQANAEEGLFAITHGPCLMVPGTDEMTVAWHTNRAGVSTVSYGLDGAVEQTAVTSRVGLIPNDSTCHAVRLTGLEPGRVYRYRVATREFRGYVTPYEVRYGDTAESDAFTFSTFDPNKSAFSFLMWNDIHDDSARLEAMFNDVSWDGVDFAVFNGDMLNDFVHPNQPFGGFYDAAVVRFAKSLPTVFVRGNHETRGPMARRLEEYFPGRDGRFYWSFDHGPAHVVVLDSGEDKPDDHREYAGLVDFAAYRQEQTEWLRNDLASEAARRAKFRIVLSHQPAASAPSDNFGAQEIRRLWDPIVNAANVQLWLSGHLHEYKERRPHDAGDNAYHAVVNPADGTTRVDVNAEAIQVTVIRKGGSVLASTRIPAA